MDPIKEAMILADDARRDAEDWNGKHQRACLEIARLRAALMLCAADYISDPCSVIEGHSMLSVEFRRRMEIAHAALSQ